MTVESFSSGLLSRRTRAAVAGFLGSVALLLAGSALAQGSVQYQVSGPSSAPFTAVQGGTTILSSQNSEQVTLPFPFSFYGKSYSTVYVSLYGYASFSGPGTQTSNPGIPHNNSSASYPANVIAPWWDTLTRVSGTSFVRTLTSGAEPNRKFTIEWKEMGVPVTSGLAPRVTFQVTLFEKTNQIRLSYAPFTLPATAQGSASVGVMESLGAGISLLPCTSSSSGTCTTSQFPGASNQGQAIDVFVPPDLSATNVGGQDTGYAGVAFRATALVKNSGGRQTLNAKVRFFLSSDAVLDGADDVIGDSAGVDVPAGGETLAVVQGGIPSTKTPGNYFLLARVDPDSLIPELNENNNISSAISVKVGNPTPDLLVTGVTVPGQGTAVPGQTLTVSRVVTNGGNAAAPANVKYQYFLSTNAVVSISDDPLGTALTLADGIGTSQSSTASDMVVLPSTLKAGKYWVGLCVDHDPTATPNSTLTEINELNNCGGLTNGIIINTGALAVITTSLPGAAQFAPYGYRLEAAGGNGSYTWTVAAGSLPPGFSLSSEGDLLGTATAPGAFAFDVKVTSGAEEKIQSLSLTVTQSDLPLAIVDQQLPIAEFSRRYEAALVAVGGKPPYRWTLKSGSKLPAGFALAGDGRLEGRATEVGNFPFSVELEDNANVKAAKDLQLTVLAPTSLRIATARLSTAYLGQSYAQLLQALGGRGPYEWSLVSFQQLAENLTEIPGKLETKIPEGFGLTLEKDAADQWALTGLPSKAGLYAVTLKVIDNSTGAEDATTLTLRVSYEKALAITTTALPDAFLGRPYAAGLTHNGGKLEVKYETPCVAQVDSTLMNWGCAPTDELQKLPPGIELNPVTGELRGSPAGIEALAKASGDSSASVTYSFLVKLTDKAGRQDVRSLSIKVRPDYTKSGGCSQTGLAPSALALLGLLGWRRSSTRRGRKI